MNTLLESITNLVYPTRCGFCSAIIPAKSCYNLCYRCINKLSIITYGCRKCGKSLKYSYDEICQDCKTLNHHFDRAFSVVIYEGCLKRMLINYKYYNNKYFIDTLGKILLNKAWEIKGIDLIIPVPLHREKLKLRGFNQAEKIAKIVAKKLNIKVDAKSLIKVKNTVSQATLDRCGRLENLKNAFEVYDNTKIRNKNILIIDDIYTTGSTASECARALKSAGSAKVFVLTVASGRGF